MTNDASRKIFATWLKNLSIVTFFGVQLFMALPGFLYNRYEDDGRFSWNMYSTLYRCDVRYDLLRADGARAPINYRQLLNNPTRSYEFLDRSDLPKFNQFVCNIMRRQREPGEIHASVVCQLNDRPSVQFITQGVDLCTASNYGVPP